MQMFMYLSGKTQRVAISYRKVYKNFTKIAIQVLIYILFVFKYKN